MTSFTRDSLLSNFTVCSTYPSYLTVLVAVPPPLLQLLPVTFLIVPDTGVASVDCRLKDVCNTGLKCNWFSFCEATIRPNASYANFVSPPSGVFCQTN